MCALSEREQGGLYQGLPGLWVTRVSDGHTPVHKVGCVTGRRGESWKPQDWEWPQNVPEGEEAQSGGQHWPGQKRVGRDAMRDSLAVSPGREPSPGSWGDMRPARGPPKAKEYGRPASNTRNYRPTHTLDASLENDAEGKRPVPKDHTLYHSIYKKVWNRYNHRKRGQELRWGGVGGSHMRGSCGDRNRLVSPTWESQCNTVTRVLQGVPVGGPGKGIQGVSLQADLI